MVSFSFTQKGQVENQIVHLKTQKLYDKIGKIIEPKQNWDITLNLDVNGRNLDFKGSLSGTFHQYMSNRKIKFGLGMLIGITTYKFDINEERLNETLHDLVYRSETMTRETATWYDLVGLSYILAIINEGEMEADVNAMLDKLDALGTDEENFKLASLNVMMGIA
jgi:hypothetical protein